jgi:hypothetical protein
LWVNFDEHKVGTFSRAPKASLERHKIYRVLPHPEAEKDGDIRIIDESGEDYLYPKDWFVLITVPDAVEASLLRTA